MTNRRTLLTALAILLLALAGLTLVALDRPAPEPVATAVPDLTSHDELEPVARPGIVDHRDTPGPTETHPASTPPATSAPVAGSTPHTSVPAAVAPLPAPSTTSASEPAEVVTPAPEPAEVTTEPTCGPGELYDPTIPACVAQQLDDEAIGGARCDDPLKVVVAVLETGELVCGQP